jgi:hypothetical protein
MAQKDFQFEEVKNQLIWLDGHGGIINKFSKVNDAKLWLALNTNADSEKLEENLAKFDDEKHRFWLILLKLQHGNVNDAQKLVNTYGESPLGKLGQGLLSFSKGDLEGVLWQLEDSRVAWTTLSRSKLTLRHLILAKTAMKSDDYTKAQLELMEAQQLEPSNPVCIMTAFDIAAGSGQWTKAEELGHLIGEQSWSSKNGLFETKLALLAIHENDLTTLSESLDTLKELPNGVVNANYLMGIQSLSQGNLQRGQTDLESAVKSGLNGGLKVDAQKALEQILEREKADNTLKTVVEENGK